MRPRYLVGGVVVVRDRVEVTDAAKSMSAKVNEGIEKGVKRG